MATSRASNDTAHDTSALDSSHPVSSSSQELASIEFVDADGQSEVRVSGGVFVGKVRGAPRTVSAGMRLEVLLVRVENVDTSDGDLELIGRVNHVEGLSGSTATPVFAGLKAGLVVESLIEVQDDRTRIETGTIKAKALRMPMPVIARFDALDLDATAGNPGDTELTPRPFRSAEIAPVPTSDERLNEPSGVIGTLRQVSLPEVIQGLELSRKTARIDIDQGRDKPRGAVFLADGEVVHARLGTESGESAFYTLAALSVGTYRIRFNRRTDRQTVTKPTGFLLLEAMRLVDERSKADDEAPRPITLESVPAYIPSGSPDPVTLDVSDEEQCLHPAPALEPVAEDSFAHEAEDGAQMAEEAASHQPLSEEASEQSGPLSLDDGRVKTAELTPRALARKSKGPLPASMEGGPLLVTDAELVPALDDIHDLPTKHGLDPVRPALVSNGPLFGAKKDRTPREDVETLAEPAPVRRTLEERPPRLKTASGKRAVAEPRIETSPGAQIFSGFFAEASTSDSGEFVAVDEAAIVGTQTDSFEAVAG